MGDCSTVHYNVFCRSLGGLLIVDYGEKHSKKHGHSRYGRVFRAGLCPKWSAMQPLHFLGHSMVSAMGSDVFGVSCSDHLPLGWYDDYEDAGPH